MELVQSLNALVNERHWIMKMKKYLDAISTRRLTS